MDHGILPRANQMYRSMGKYPVTTLSRGIKMTFSQRGFTIIHDVLSEPEPALTRELVTGLIARYRSGDQADIEKNLICCPTVNPGACLALHSGVLWRITESQHC